MARPRREPPPTEAELMRQIILQLQEQMQQLTMVVHTLAEPHLFDFSIIDRSSLGILMGSNNYLSMDESLFIEEEEESHFIYREIYGDPIFDSYEDEILFIDPVEFVIRDSYDQSDRTASPSDHSREVQSVRKNSYDQSDRTADQSDRISTQSDRSGGEQCGRDFIQQVIFMNLRPIRFRKTLRLKTRQNQQRYMKINIRKDHTMKNLLKIRGRILVPNILSLIIETTKIPYPIRGRIFLTPGDLMQHRLHGINELSFFIDYDLEIKALIPSIFRRRKENIGLMMEIVI